MAIDWTRIADRLQNIRRVMAYEENYRGDNFEAEAMRRCFGYVAADSSGPDGRAREVPYERLQHGQGLTTDAEAKYVRDGHTVIDRLNRERAEQQVKEMRAEVARVYLEARKDVAAAIRSRCNEYSVPSKYRREGVELAADWIDPGVPKDRYGNILPRDAEVREAS